jgi:hypothetical protein
MIKIIFLARKFYFATNISVRSTLVSEKGRVRNREALKHTEPEHCFFVLTVFNSAWRKVPYVWYEMHIFF